jgi:hypothetical protein
MYEATIGESPAEMVASLPQTFTQGNADRNFNAGREDEGWNRGMDTFNANARTQGMQDRRTGMMIQGAGMGVDPGSIPFQGEPPVFNPRSPISSMWNGAMPMPQQGMPMAQPAAAPPAQSRPQVTVSPIPMGSGLPAPGFDGGNYGNGDEFLRGLGGRTPPNFRTNGGRTPAQAAASNRYKKDLGVTKDEQAVRKSDYDYNRQMKRDPLEDENLKLDVQIKRDKLKGQANPATKTGLPKNVDELAANLGFNKQAREQGYNRVGAFIGDRLRADSKYFTKDAKGKVSGLSAEGVKRRDQINRTEAQRAKGKPTAKPTATPKDRMAKVKGIIARAKARGLSADIVRNALTNEFGHDFPQTRKQMGM